MQVCVNGRPAKEYTHNGFTYVEARKGTSYSVKVYNNNWVRALVILSVDGIDVLRGKKAEDAHEGYIVNAYSHIEIKGYRINDNEVSVFVFGDGDKSYANFIVKNKYNKKNTNNGVIGAKVVLEKVPEITWTTLRQWTDEPSARYYTPEIPQDSAVRDAYGIHYNTCLNKGKDWTEGRERCVSALNAMYNNVSVGDTPNFDVGTRWGNNVKDVVTKVSFEPSDQTLFLSIFYASKESLAEAGVKFDKEKAVASTGRLPQAFGDQYCPRPY